MDTTPIWLLAIIATLLWPTALFLLWREIEHAPLEDGEYSRLDRMDDLGPEDRAAAFARDLR